MITRIILFTLIALAMIGPEIFAQDMSNRSIVVYYSRRGQNYRGGEIVDLKVGNTEVVALKIQGHTGGDIFRVETEKPYPVDYHETTVVAKKERADNARPKMKEESPDMGKYDIVYLGYPNWWGTMPMVLFSFLESFNSKGKTIIPFCTHEGSRMGRSVADIKKLCPEAVVLDGLAIQGGNVNTPETDTEIERWIKSSK